MTKLGVTMCLLTAVVVGCGKSSPLVGSWKVDPTLIQSMSKNDMGATLTITQLRLTFKDDGSYELQPVGEFGQYKLAGKTVTITPDKAKTKSSGAEGGMATLSDDGRTLSLDLGMTVKFVRAD